MCDLEPILPPVIRINHLLPLVPTKIAEQHQMSGGSFATTILRRPPVTGSLQVAQIISIHSQDVVKVGKVGQLENTRAVTIVYDAVIFQCAHGARIRAIAGMISARAGGVDAGDARVGIREGAENSFGHRRSAWGWGMGQP